MFWDQWECFFKNGLYKYDTIFVWIGNHSRMSEDGKSHFTEYDYRRFRSDFRNLIEQCFEKSPNVVVLSTLHMFKCRRKNQSIERIRRKLMIKPKETLDYEENIVVEGKNRIMQEIADEKGIKFYDIDSTLMKSKFWHTDVIHYMPESNKFVADILIRLMGK